MEMKPVRKLAGWAGPGDEGKAQRLLLGGKSDSVGHTMETPVKDMLLRLEKYLGPHTDGSERKVG